MKAIIESVNERSSIQAAISNANQALRYFKKCQKYHKETGDEAWNEIGDRNLFQYYNALLSVQDLANKYNELWLEKYSRTKHFCEKALNIGL